MLYLYTMLLVDCAIRLGMVIKYSLQRRQVIRKSEVSIHEVLFIYRSINSKMSIKYARLIYSRKNIKIP